MGRIFLVDENDYHQYLYKIHEVCNKEYKVKDIIVPFSRLIKDKKINFIQASVNSVDPERRVVNTIQREIKYDILVIALGSHVAYFNIEGLEKNSLSLDSFNSAKKIRAQILDLFNEAKKKKIPPKIVIGGGGFTGVELAGEIADWYPLLCIENNLENSDNYVSIIEMMPSILPGWNRNLVIKGQEVLSKLGIELVLNDAVSRVYNGKIELKSGRILNADLFIWNGGVRGDPACGTDLDIKARRIVIDEYCRTLKYKDIYVAGDSACTVNGEGLPLPPTAHIAMVQGELVANNIIASIKNKPMKPYLNKHIGEIVTLGRTYAIGELYGIKFKGTIARFVKKLVHWWYLYSIGGFDLLFR
jgi:NADH dehydrogenase